MPAGRQRYHRRVVVARLEQGIGGPCRGLSRTWAPRPFATPWRSRASGRRSLGRPFGPFHEKRSSSSVVVAVPPAGSDLGHAGRLRRAQDRSRPWSAAITYRVVARGAVVVASRARRASMIRLAPIAVPVNRSPAPGRGESRPGLWLACLEHDGAGRLTGVSRETVRDGRSRRSRPRPVAASPGPAVATCRAEDGASALWAFHVKRSRTAGRG